jgi:thiol:disulfide interchange protein DsbD
LSKRKKRIKGRKNRARKNKKKKNLKQNGNGTDEKEDHESTSHKKKQSKKRSQRSLGDEFLARRRRQDIIFVTSIIIVASLIFVGYYLYETQWISGEDETDFDNNDLNLESDNNPGNSGGNDQTEEIEWLDYEEGISRAQSNNKPIIIDFYTDWCIYCVEMDQNTYSDSRVIEKSKEFINIKVDCDVRTDIKDDYSVDSYPTTVFLDTQQNEIHRINGYVPAGPFLEDMDYALTNA